MPIVFVENTTARRIGLARGTARKHFTPGVNTMSSEELDALVGEQPSKVARHFFESGQLKVLPVRAEETEPAAAPQGGEGKAGHDKPAGDLVNLNAKKAIEFIGSTFDRSLLEKWAVEDTRTTVINAIDEQLKKLDAAGGGEGKAGG